MLSPIEILAILTRRLEATNSEGVPVVGRKSAQVIPFAWNTLPTHDMDYVVGIPQCTCPWLDDMTPFCGLSLFHRERTACPTCAQPIVHVPESVPYIVRLAKVSVRLEPSRDFVAYTRRSRRVVSVPEPVQIRIGDPVSIYKTTFDKFTMREQQTVSMVIARVIIITSNVRLTLRSPRRADVIYSDGIHYNGTDTYTCTTPSDPVIFSIAGAGALITLTPLHNKPMLIYEVTTITAADTTSIQPHGIELYPEARRLSKALPVKTLTVSPSLMHSSHSFIQPHRLSIRIEKRALVFTIEHDPVLVFFNRAKNLLHVYTGTSVYALRVFLNRSTWRPECYCMRESIHESDNDHITLDQLTQSYGALVSTLPIETLLLIHADRNAIPDFKWNSVPMS